MTTGSRHTSNRVKRKLQAGEPVTALRVFEFLRPAVAKVAAQAGFDMVVIEAEQQLAGPREVTDRGSRTQRRSLRQDASTA